MNPSGLTPTSHRPPGPPVGFDRPRSVSRARLLTGAAGLLVVALTLAGVALVVLVVLLVHAIPSAPVRPPVATVSTR